MNKRIIFCNCKGKVVEPGRLEEISSYMIKQEIPFVQLSDFCGICATQKDKVHEIIEDYDEIMMIACYPRAVKLLAE